MSNPSPNILILNLNRETGFMIIVMRKSNLVLIGLIFALLLAIYSLNMDVDSQTAAAAKTADQRTVIVDAGHGGEDPGKISSYSGLKEKDQPNRFQ